MGTVGSWHAPEWDRDSHRDGVQRELPSEVVDGRTDHLQYRRTLFGGEPGEEALRRHDVDRARTRMANHLYAVEDYVSAISGTGAEAVEESLLDSAADAGAQH